MWIRMTVTKAHMDILQSSKFGYANSYRFSRQGSIIREGKGNPMRSMLNLTDSITLTTIITGFIALKIDQTSEIKIHDETHYEHAP
jgi:hypothetical protein